MTDASSASGRMDVTALLASDHRALEQLFREYESGAGDLSPHRKRELVERIVKELSVHAAAEEQVVYPALRRIDSIGEQLAEDSLGDHQRIKSVLSQLDGMSGDDPEIDVLVESLVEDVTSHVEEEEGEVFTQLRSGLSEDELVDMARAVDRAKSIAPTRPHPHAPSTPPGNIVGGAAAGVVDRLRDAASGRGD